jgi:catechol 2,3-dioxygenase-like lactoylglutathione lyase family enzyme
MLADKDAMATIAVKDLAAAKGFYQGKLGLKPAGPENDQAMIYKSGSASVVIYRSEFAGTNQATTATWGLGTDLDNVVRSLKQAGIKFEHYDMPGATREGDIHVFGDFRAAWFKDPDGNILHINNG